MQHNKKIKPHLRNNQKSTSLTIETRKGTKTLKVPNKDLRSYSQ